MDVDKFRKVLGDLVNDVSLQSSVGKTFCNIAIYRISKLFWIEDFKLDENSDPPMANKMCEILGVSRNFKSINALGAHTAALAGQFTLAAHMYETHGHVAVVYPSPTMYYSSSWKKEEPFVANVGKTCGIMPTSEAFIVALGEPDFYVYKS